MKNGACTNRVESSDLDEYVQCVKPWDVRLDQLSRGRFRAEMQAVITTGLVVYEERWNRRVAVTGSSPEGFLMLGTNAIPCQTRVGWCGHTIDHRRFACRSSGGAVDFTIPEGGHHAVLMVRPSLLAAALGEECFAALSHLSHVTYSPDDGRRLVRSIIETVRMGAAHPGQLDDPLVAASIESRLLENLGRFNDPTEVRDDPDAKRIRSAAVRRAMDLVTRSDGLLTALELAMKVNVSQRTLEYGFRESHGISPGRYLISHRMNEARRALQRSDPDMTTVKRVAKHWGFGHPGRFAVRYRGLFGERPSETLARSRRRARSFCDPRGG